MFLITLKLKIMTDTRRLEAFSNSMFAITITIMVAKLAVPFEADLAALRPLLPVFLTYLLSFVYIGIFLNNHHHLLYLTKKVGGGALWANLHLLFWLSLIPFVTAWIGSTGFASIPTVLYGVVLLMTAFAWWLLERVIMAEQNQDSLLSKAIRGTYKEKLSLGLYITAIFLAFVEAWISCVLYAVVALLWIVPDRRMERVLTEEG